MKQQLLQKREILIQHLQTKIKSLREERDILFKAQEQPKEVNFHVNIKNYLKNQTFLPNKQQMHSSKKISNFQLAQNLNIPPVLTYSKTELLRQQRQIKHKIQMLGELYHKKKRLQSIGIHQNNADKINNFFNNTRNKKQIEKKMERTKAKKLEQEKKEKIIQQELANAKAFLKESKAGKTNFIPEKHFTKIFADDQDKLIKITSLLHKKNLSLVEKDDILWIAFQFLRDKHSLDKITSKQALRQFLLSNIQICDIFHITKNQIMRDLEVYQTKQPNLLTYQQFYEFIKSIEITNLALKPNLKYRKKIEEATPNKTLKVETDSKGQKSKEMESYLKRLYNYLDNKHQRVIQRNKLGLALKKALLFDNKKYKKLTKRDIEQFEQQVERTKQKCKQRDYYKNLDIKYIGLQQILHIQKHPVNLIDVDIQEPTQSMVSEKSNQIIEQVDRNEIQNVSEEQIEILKCDLKLELQPQDFQRYGWQGRQQNDQKFNNVKKLDKYYGQMQQKYGNEIAWNGFQHYLEDFSKFNECIKELSSKNEREIKK